VVIPNTFFLKKPISVGHLGHYIILLIKKISIFNSVNLILSLVINWLTDTSIKVKLKTLDYQNFREFLLRYYVLLKVNKQTSSFCALDKKIDQSRTVYTKDSQITGTDCKL
jgi:hypothetical protein